jgi:hypothetical protein
VKEIITDALDAFGLLAVAAGVGAGAATWVGWWGLAISGGILVGGSQLAARLG